MHAAFLLFLKKGWGSARAGRMSFNEKMLSGQVAPRYDSSYTILHEDSQHSVDLYQLLPDIGLALCCSKAWDHGLRGEGPQHSFSPPHSGPWAAHSSGWPSTRATKSCSGVFKGRSSQQICGTAQTQLPCFPKPSWPSTVLRLVSLWFISS